MKFSGEFDSHLYFFLLSAESSGTDSRALLLQVTHIWDFNQNDGTITCQFNN